MVSLQKLALFLLTPFNFLIFFFHGSFISFSLASQITLGVTAVNITLLYKIFFYQDTLVDSPFFSIDRARSIRFAMTYFIALVIITSIVLGSFFITVAGIAALIIIIIISIINLFIAIVGLIILIFSGGFPGFVGYDFAGEVFVILFSSVEVYSNPVLANTLIVIFVLVGFAVASYAIGRYIEDTDSGLAVIMLTHNLIYLFIILTLIPEGNLNSLGILPALYMMIVTPIFSYSITTRVFGVKEAQDDYELPELGKWRKRLFGTIVLLAYSAGIALIGLLTVSFLAYGFDLLSIVLYLLLVIVFCFLVLSSIIWVFRGDFPVEIRIFEIEYREELLAKAEEFRNMK